MTRVLSTRVEDEIAAAFDEVAATRGMARGELLANLIDRTVASTGMLTMEQVAERREARRRRVADHKAMEAVRRPEAVRDPDRYPIAEDVDA